MSAKLKQLLKRSAVLLEPQDRESLPIVGKDAEQLLKHFAAQSEKIQASKEQQAKAHYFLASNGINIQSDIRPTDIKYAFDTIQMDSHTDIEKFLTEEHERILIDVIEEQRRQDDEDFKQFYSTQLDLFTKHMEEEQKDAEESKIEINELSKNINRVNQYAFIIKTLNDCRINNDDFNLVEQLSTVQNTSDLTRFQASVSQAWDILSYFMKQTDNEGRREGRFTRSYLVQPYQSFPAVETRRKLIDASRSWLEEQFLQTVNEQLHAHATKLKIGGNPYITHRLEAYINLNYKTVLGWRESRLEIVHGLPIWLFIYLLLRTGHTQVAADYIKENKDIFRFDKKFVAYFQEYIESPQHCVSKETHDEILAEHYRLEYGEGKADPYKSLLYKIIGRCELNKKSTAIIKSQDDYLWLQLMLVREVTDTENYAYQRYRLQDLQNHTPIMAETQKDDVWAQFKLLLLTLQFEKAIDFIHTGNKLWLEATHFATALAYHETLQYLYLLSLYSTKQGYHNDEMISLAKSYLCKVTVKSQNHKEFIDIIYGQREPSILQSQKVLLDINSDQEYAQQILYPVADLLLQSGHCREAIDVCKLSIDYNKLFDVLAKELGDVLQQSKLSRLSDTTASNKDILQFATQTVQECQQQQHLKALPNTDKVFTVHLLMQLVRFRMLYEQGEFFPAISIIRETQLIPFDEQLGHVQLAAEQFEHLHETIKKNIPEILLNVMDILYKLWETYSSASLNVAISNNTIEDVEKQARAVLTFVGIIQFNIPAEILVKLNKIDMLMAQRRRL
ncbi:NIC-domain-containing protein [Rhizopus microsporus var. microsporus]|uniref:Nuclear pore protein n=1 Tax=Rhizopus microsporus var. microsporus TaxID=86635 RepID=A0A1X0QP48_RHIZD|nr:NIC-domain-containing protein [Rhizopus microsporus var. microsporus]